MTSRIEIRPTHEPFCDKLIIERRKEGIWICACIDGTGNEFLVPYELFSTNRKEIEELVKLKERIDKIIFLESDKSVQKM